MRKSVRSAMAAIYFDDYKDKGFDRTFINATREIMCLHGSGGKIAEELCLEKFEINDFQGIHKWDGITPNGRLVEIKTETVNDSKKLNAEGSFPEQRHNNEGFVSKEITYQEETPYLISIGTCRNTGQCIYVMCTDFAKLPEGRKNCKVWKRLDAKSPRFNFSQVADHPEAYRLIFCNPKLVEKNRENFNKNFLEAIERMMKESLSLDALMR